MAKVVTSARTSPAKISEDCPLRRFSWAIGMEYPLEFGRLSRLSYLGIGLRNELQIPEWDFKSTIDTLPTGRLFLQKSPRNVFTRELKRDMVDNDKRLKSSMTDHRKEMLKKSQELERDMREHEKPFVCHRGNIKSRYGDKFNKLPSSLRARVGSTVTQTTNTAAPLTVMDAETLISEQYVVCRRCNKTYKESRNTETSCRYHHGPIIAVFGGMCQNCGMLDYTDGCVVGFHTRKKRQAASPERKRIINRSPIKGKPPKLPETIEDEGVQA